MASEDDLVSAIRNVWRIPAPGPNNLLADPRFMALADQLGGGAEGAKVAFALSHALRALGLPCAMRPGAPPGDSEPETVAAALREAFGATTTKRRHLCPLDLADVLPVLTFGSAQVGSFDASTLEALFDRPRLERIYPSRKLDFHRLARLQWLVVEEVVTIDPRPEARAIPILFQRMDQDFGAFDPLARRYPAAVERALFCLLLAPWETWSSMLEVDWRGFRLPWIYTVDADLAVQPAVPPDVTALTFEPDFYRDVDGEEIEVERPSVLPLDEEAGRDLNREIPDVWRRLQIAAGTELFQTPVEHFLVRAFHASGIDELLAHMTVLEAALGEEADHDRKLRPKSERTLGATERMARKIAGLLDDPSAADAYRDLFQIRSLFVHGRAGLATISTEQQVMARRLARRVANILLARAAAGPAPRAEVLADVLAKGRALGWPYSGQPAGN